MQPQTRELIELLIGCRAVQFGDFTLKSGEHSPFFVDLGAVASGRALTALGDALGRAVAAHFASATLLFGPAYKGIVLATIAAEGYHRASGRDVAVCFNRKEAKGHGEQGIYFGQKPTPQDQVVIIDDVLSSGGTKLDAANGLREAFGVAPRGVLVTLDRTRRGHTFSELPLVALINILDLAQYLDDAHDDRGGLIRRFYEGT